MIPDCIHPWPAISILMALSFAWEPLKFKNREHPQQKSRKHIFFIDLLLFHQVRGWRWRRSFSPERTMRTDVGSSQINAIHNQNSLFTIVLQKDWLNCTCIHQGIKIVLCFIFNRRRKSTLLPSIIARDNSLNYETVPLQYHKVGGSKTNCFIVRGVTWTFQ
jgi:hypothetical protein